jgi:hypothetical protein
MGEVLFGTPEINSNYFIDVRSAALSFKKSNNKCKT